MMRRSKTKSLSSRALIASTIKHLLGLTILTILITDAVQACGPGRAGGKHWKRKKPTPLVQRQYVPNVSEFTLPASGEAEGPIRWHDKRFRELVQNWNPDIEFRDDERTGEDRMMTQRLKEKLSILAISVMNQWPNVRLRIIEGWDARGTAHGRRSLHYEGRAVDITTSDRDQSKYGMLARLAVEAGFDWVNYEARSHVHCSVKSEKADTIRNNGCFDANSIVQTPVGQIEMSRLQTNDLVLTMEPTTGKLKYSPVIMWLDRDDTSDELYVELKTKSGRQISLTSSHLIYVSDEDAADLIRLQQQQQQEHIFHSPVATTSKESQQPIIAVPTGSTASNKSGNYFYYDLQQPDRSANKQNTTRDSLHRQTTFEHIDNKPSTLSDVPEQSPGLVLASVNEYAYTIYARHAAVGQYLLTSPTAIDQGAVGATQRSANEPQRPELKEDTQRAANRLVFGGRHTSGRVQSLSKNAGVSNGEATSRVIFDQIVSVNYVTKQGIYAPLTREGNIVVNSVVASCYALISDHEMAHLSFAPVRWFSYVYELLFGLEPTVPTYARTVEYIQRRGWSDYRPTPLHQTENNLSTIWRRLLAHINSSVEFEERALSAQLDHSGTVKIANHGRSIHWYPRMLFYIAKFILPTRYLF